MKKKVHGNIIVLRLSNFAWRKIRFTENLTWRSDNWRIRRTRLNDHSHPIKLCCFFIRGKHHECCYAPGVEDRISEFVNLDTYVLCSFHWITWWLNPKSQILNTKSQPMFFVITIWKEKTHMSGRKIWINFQAPQQYIHNINPWKKCSNLVQFLEYLAELFLRPLRSKDVQCWIFLFCITYRSKSLRNNTGSVMANWFFWISSER